MRPSSSATFDNPSRDGYVRLPEQALAHLQLIHVDSGLDESLLEELRAEDIDAVNAGYTEWQQTHLPGAAHVSVGWDWYLDQASGALLIARSDVRSNVMCVDPRGIDLGMTRTAQLLIRRLAALNWPSAIAHAMVTVACEPIIRGRTLQ